MGDTCVESDGGLEEAGGLLDFLHAASKRAVLSSPQAVGQRAGARTQSHILRAEEQAGGAGAGADRSGGGAQL
eukprot:749579-Hanusia_phi.AAC.5